MKMKIEIIKMYKYYLYQFFETNNLIYIYTIIYIPTLENFNNKKLKKTPCFHSILKIIKFKKKKKNYLIIYILYKVYLKCIYI